MELGTHNSMTYLKPKKWYMCLFQFVARCQSLNIKEQFEKGIRLFDIRIAYTESEEPEFRHGAIAYKGNVYATLDWLNRQNVPVKIRILLEVSKESNLKELLFIKDIRNFQTIFSNLSFYEGRRKYDWKQLLDLPTLKVTQLVSSMQGNKIDDIWPWLYAKFHNKKNLKKQYDSDILIDFVEIQ